jgi:hypothetical protein
MRALCVATCLVGLMVGAACTADGGSSEAEGATSATTAASSTTLPPPTTTTTAPVPLTTEQAAARYLAIVEPYNIALEALELGINDGQAVDALRVQAAAVATANDTHVRELQTTSWPTAVQPSVDALVAASQQAQAYWLQGAEAPTRDALIAAVLSAGEHDGGEAATTIRNLLGLGEYDEDDDA